MDMNKVELFNIGALEEIPGYEGKGLSRVPSAIRNRLNEQARIVGMDSVGIEIRFVTDAPNIDLYISMQPVYEGKSEIYIYKGNFLHQIIEIPEGKLKRCRIFPPEDFGFANAKMLNKGGYSPNVWRIVSNSAIAILHGIDTFGHDLRPPQKEELPKNNWLAYGSSITNSNLRGYPHFAASILNVQVQNKGLSGSCHIEKEMVDYLMDDCYFDFITCELGVNMREIYSLEEFERRTAYLIERLLDLGKPAVIISVFPNRVTPEYAKKQCEYSKKEAGFSKIMAKLVDEANCKTLRFINGYDVLTDINGLSSDLLHPTDYGHAIMGMNLANYLKVFLLDCGL